MSFIHYYKEPDLRNPVVVVAFGGWNDAADSATTAIKFLIDRWQPTKLAEIDAEEFFVFTETRPSIKLASTETTPSRSIIWPTNLFYEHTTPDRDMVLFLGIEPQLKWKTFSSAFLELCKRCNASEIVFLGALLADVPHSVPVPVTGYSSDLDMAERLREMALRGSNYEGPTGMIGVLHDTCRRAQLSTASIWAAAPHYLAATPNIKVTAALLTYLNMFLSLGLDLSDIQSDAVHFDEQITSLVAKDPEASAYVRRLEEQLAEGDEADEERDFSNKKTSGPLPSADSLIRDIEEQLRKQRENGLQQDDENEEDE